MFLGVNKHQHESFKYLPINLTVLLLQPQKAWHTAQSKLQLAPALRPAALTANYLSTLLAQLKSCETRLKSRENSQQGFSLRCSGTVETFLRLNKNKWKKRILKFRFWLKFIWLSSTKKIWNQKKLYFVNKLSKEAAKCDQIQVSLFSDLPQRRWCGS